MSFTGGRNKNRVVFNPRSSTTWSEDANKFGQKMLERMGWKNGQGLGKNKNGITDSVRVSYKNDVQGLGFKEITEGSVQQDNFNVLLQSLNKSLEGDAVSTPVNDVPLNSLEKKSEQSRVRVHYRKVTRGKDVSQYSQKDLANIFCKKKLKNVNEKMQEKMNAEINGGYIDSYFKSKMESKKQIKHSGNNFGDDKITKNSKDEEPKPSFVSYLEINDDLKNKKRKKSKQCSDDSMASPFKKFRSGENGDSGIINPAFEPLGNNITVNKEALDTIEESFEESVTIEKAPVENNNIAVKEEALDGIEDGSTNFLDEVSVKVEENSYEVKVKRKKKKKKKQQSDDQSNVLNLGSDTKSNNKQMGVDNPLLNLDDSVIVNTTDKSQDFEVKRKKHKKASKLGVDNVALNLSNADLSLQSIENITSSVKGIENSAFSDLVLKSVLTPQGTNKVKRTKSVRFSETNEEFLIPTRNAQEIEEENEFEINSNGIENGLKESASLEGIVNKGFNIRSKEQTNTDPKIIYKSGIDNQAYDERNQNVEEAIQSLTDSIDQYQAEVENGINESKAKKRKRKSLENRRDATLQ